MLLGTCILLACSKVENPPAAVASLGDPPADGVVEVWKTPTCGCCTAWIDHLKANDFPVKVHDVSETASFREALGLSADYGSCHTARVNGYVVEGHVPADDIKKLLAEKPDAVGLTVPGMPMGSPGMENAKHPTHRAEYDVFLVRKDGVVSSYTRYNAVGPD